MAGITQHKQAQTTRMVAGLLMQEQKFLSFLACQSLQPVPLPRLLWYIRPSSSGLFGLGEDLQLESVQVRCGSLNKPGV